MSIEQPKSKISSSRAMTSTFWRAVFPNPTPGSRTIRECAIPAFSASANERAKNRRISAMISIDAFVFSPVMHDHHRRLGGGNRVGHGRIFLQPPDVVHQHGAQFDRTRADIRLIGIDRKRHFACIGELGQDRFLSGELLGFRYRYRSRSSRLRAYIDDVATFCRHPLCVGQRRLCCNEPATVRRRNPASS